MLISFLAQLRITTKESGGRRGPFILGGMQNMLLCSRAWHASFRLSRPDSGFEEI